MTLASTAVTAVSNPSNGLIWFAGAAFILLLGLMIWRYILYPLDIYGVVSIVFGLIVAIAVAVTLFLGVRLAVIARPSAERTAASNISKVEDSYRITGLDGWNGYTDDPESQSVWFHGPDGRASAGKLHIHDGKATLYVNGAEYRGAAK